ncbi:hypothetical protein HPB51_008183 [Rhipicephalus microplus]|uniref:RING-type domain-containing protein n=1 Tax=Rhipicephalus microplus TaxID=6941 RepID=A0A9J6E897_RHIMP|nr:hypothetical protein HPB51_008183 [Rhipicephalus microplus]
MALRGSSGSVAMPKRGRVLRRVRDSDVPGVNWRPTLFAEEFLHPHACCLCQVIPRNTILLPCTHALCDTCERGSLRRNGTGGTCPLCGENFEEDECQAIKISPKKASNLKGEAPYALGRTSRVVVVASFKVSKRWHSEPTE